MTFRLVPFAANGIEGYGENTAVIRERFARFYRTTPFDRVVGIRVRQGAVLRTMGRATIRSRVRAAVTTCLFHRLAVLFRSEVLVLLCWDCRLLSQRRTV